MHKLYGTQIVAALILDGGLAQKIADVLNEAVDLSERVYVIESVSEDVRVQARALNDLCGDVWEQAVQATMEN